VQNGENPGNEFDQDSSGPKYPRTARDLGAVAFQVSLTSAAACVFDVVVVITLCTQGVLVLCGLRRSLIAAFMERCSV
jgi:hypothetical protein